MKPHLYSALGHRVESDGAFADWAIRAMAVVVYVALIWAVGR